MLTHVTDTGVIYIVTVPQEEVDRRMATLIKALYPTFLELRASAREAETQIGEVQVVGSSPQHKNQIASSPCLGVLTHAQPRPRLHESMEVTG